MHIAQANTVTAVSGTLDTSRLVTWISRAMWLGWIPLVLFLVFFTSMPDIHNAMHGVRHSSSVVQCH